MAQERHGNGRDGAIGRGEGDARGIYARQNRMARLDAQHASTLRAMRALHSIDRPGSETNSGTMSNRAQQEGQEHKARGPRTSTSRRHGRALRQVADPVAELQHLRELLRGLVANLREAGSEGTSSRSPAACRTERGPCPARRRRSSQLLSSCSRRRHLLEVPSDLPLPQIREPVLVNQFTSAEVRHRIQRLDEGARPDRRRGARPWSSSPCSSCPSC